MNTTTWIHREADSDSPEEKALRPERVCALLADPRIRHMYLGDADAPAGDGDSRLQSGPHPAP